MRSTWLAAAVGCNAAIAVPWWIALFAAPWTRDWFLPSATPDSALLSFALADAVFFIGAGLAAATGIARGAAWARPALWLHTGGACYAAMYVLLQWMLTGEAWLAAAAMMPSLVLLPYACWWMEHAR
ncbi:MAG: hypothetical protein HY820_39990 [Acidobacteria bacterium]|nr:hypothetical protein [Acidobacteriota bacterium]